MAATSHYMGNFKVDCLMKKDNVTFMSDTIILHIHGVPHAQPRPRWIKGKMISVVDKKTKAWAEKVRESAFEIKEIMGKEVAILSAGAIELIAEFRIPTEDETLWGEFHTHKPDNDNLLKLVMDGLFKEKGDYLFKCGDERVARTGVTKIWCKPRYEGVTVVLKRMEHVKIAETNQMASDWLVT